MSRLTDIATASLEMEVAILKIQIALKGVESIDAIREELERSLRLANILKNELCSSDGAGATNQIKKNCLGS